MSPAGKGRGKASPRKIKYEPGEGTGGKAEPPGGDEVEQPRKGVLPRRHRFAFLGTAAVAALMIVMRTKTMFDDGRGDNETFVTAYWTASAVMLLLLLSGAAFGGAALAGLSDLAAIFWLYGFEAADVFMVTSGPDRSADPEYMIQLGGAACLYTTGVHLLLVRWLRLQDGWAAAGGATCIGSRLAFAAASLYELLSKQCEQERCWEPNFLVTMIVGAAARDAMFCGVMVAYSLAWIRTHLLREEALKSEEEAAARMSEDLVLLEGLTGGGQAHGMSESSFSKLAPGAGLGFGTDSISSGRLLGLLQTTTGAATRAAQRFRSFDVLSSFVSNVNMLQSSATTSQLLGEDHLLQLSQASAALQTAHLWFNRLNTLATEKPTGTQGADGKDIEPLLVKLKTTLKLRGDIGVVGLAHKFQQMDVNNDKKISKNEYAQAMNEMDLGFTAAEMWALFGYFDRDNSGDIDYDEFIQGVQNQGERSLGGEQSKANMVCIIGADSGGGGGAADSSSVVPMLESAGLVCQHWKPRQGTYVLSSKESADKADGGKKGARGSLQLSVAEDIEHPLFFGVGQASSFFREAGIVMAVVASGDAEQDAGAGLTMTMVVHLTALMYRGRRVLVVLSEGARKWASKKAEDGEAGAVATHEMYELLANSARATGTQIFNDVEAACKKIIDMNVDVSTVLPAAQNYFIAAREEFRSEANSDMWDQVMAWEAGKVEGSALKESLGAKVPGICAGPLGNPVFTCFVNPEHKVKPGTVFYEDDEMLIFPNIKTATRSKEGEAAAMSYVHYLIIPKQRIYNAVTLEPADVPMLQRMQQKGIEVLGSEALKKFYLDPESGEGEGGSHSLDLSPELIMQSADQLSFFVHVHPRHSVGHLHIHCCLRNLWTANGNALKYKNTELSDVIQCLNSQRLVGDVPPTPKTLTRRMSSMAGESMKVFMRQSSEETDGSTTPRTQERKMAVHSHPQDE